MISIFSFQFILRRLENINAPTETKAIDVHGVYTVPLTLIPAKTLKTGNIAKLKKNNKPVVIAAIPVLAPLSTPTVDSANDVTGEVPKIPEIIPPVASAIITLVPTLTFPVSLSIAPIGSLIAISVAEVSKR